MEQLSKVIDKLQEVAPKLPVGFKYANKDATIEVSSTFILAHTNVLGRSDMEMYLYVHKGWRTRVSVTWDVETHGMNPDTTKAVEIIAEILDGLESKTKDDVLEKMRSEIEKLEESKLKLQQEVERWESQG